MAAEIPGSLRFDQANVAQRSMRLLAGTRPMAWLFARVLHHLDGPVMRRSAGRHSVAAALTGLPIVELTTVGARTGESRTLPLVGVPDGDRLVLVASNYGKQKNPAWYYNLKAWASTGLTDIQHKGHSPRKDVQNGDHGEEEAASAPLVHSGVQG